MHQLFFNRVLTRIKKDRCNILQPPPPGHSNSTCAACAGLHSVVLSLKTVSSEESGDAGFSLVTSAARSANDEPQLRALHTCAGSASLHIARRHRITLGAFLPGRLQSRFPLPDWFALPFALLWFSSFCRVAYLLVSKFIFAVKKARILRAEHCLKQIKNCRQHQ